MSDPTIRCPNCNHEIALSESLAARNRAELAETLEAERAAIAEAAAATARAAADAQAAARQAEIEAKLHEMAEQAEAQAAKLAEARKVQAEALRRERALKDREAELDVTLETRLNAELAKAQATLKAQAEASVTERARQIEEQNALALAQKDEEMRGLKAQIEALKNRSDKTSQQLQGEAAEVLLEDRLARAFPVDTIAPVGKGMRGADCLQRVGGTGAILWEAKNTQSWQAAWLPKLRDNQRAVGAEVAVIVSQVLPKEVETFGLVDGVWVTAPAYAVPLASVLRQGLAEVAGARALQEGQAGKMEMIYDYLTGPRFKHRVEAIVERFEDMRADLERERKAMTRLWAKREAQIAGVLDATVGMYGDLEGIAGRAMPAIEGLDLLEGPEE
ncbi:MAG: DUF2130 domain-containing protein [Pseudomonadota bacterium]